MANGVLLVALTVEVSFLAHAAGIGPSSFVNPHVTTYDGLNWSSGGHGQHSTPVVIDGNTYTSDTGAIGWEYFNRGCGTPPTYQCIDSGGAYIDIVLGTPALRAGAWIGGLAPGEASGKPPTTGTLAFYDTTGNLLGTVAVTVPALYTAAFGGWQTDGNPIGRVRITDTTMAANNFTVFIDNLTTDASQPTPQTGIVNVTSTPPGAFFQLSGPGLTFYSGNAPQAIPLAPAGDYKITWGILLGRYTTPPPETKTLAPGGTLNFVGIYTVPACLPPTIDRTASAGVVDVSIAISGCQATVTITNTKTYWTNFRLTTAGGTTFTPVGGDTNLYAKFHLLPPAGTLGSPVPKSVSYAVTFTQHADTLIVFTDPSIESGLGAGIMNGVQSILNVIPFFGSAITLVIDDYEKLAEAVAQMPHFNAALVDLFQRHPNLTAFAQDFGAFAASEQERNTFALATAQIQANISVEVVKQVINESVKKIWLILSSIVAAFGNLYTGLFGYPSGSISIVVQ